MDFVNIPDLLSNPHDKYVRVAAPMVRYSKLPFRLLVRKYGCEVVYTPMIMADSFSQSEVARQMDHFSDQDRAHDRPLVAQFAARSLSEFLPAVQLMAPHVDGVDLNCGCPQRWAIQEGIGASLLDRNRWDRVAEMLKDSRSMAAGRSISVKIRVKEETRETVEMVRRLEATGVDWITVHGRTVDQRPSDPVDWDQIKLVRESVGCPVIANGNVFTSEDADALQRYTGVHGIMAARGLLRNPALFRPLTTTPRHLLADWIDLSLAYGLPTALFHHQVVEMTEAWMDPWEHRMLTGLSNASMPAILNWLNEIK